MKHSAHMNALTTVTVFVEKENQQSRGKEEESRPRVLCAILSGADRSVGKSAAAMTAGFSKAGIPVAPCDVRIVSGPKERIGRSVQCPQSPALSKPSRPWLSAVTDISWNPQQSELMPSMAMWLPGAMQSRAAGSGITIATNSITATVILKAPADFFNPHFIPDPPGSK